MMRLLNRVLILLSVLVTLASASPQQASAAETREHVIERDYTTKLTYRCIVTVPDEYKEDEASEWPMFRSFLGVSQQSVGKALRRADVGIILAARDQGISEGSNAGMALHFGCFRFSGLP